MLEIKPTSSGGEQLPTELLEGVNKSCQKTTQLTREGWLDKNTIFNIKD